jgi:hypothetical protein
LGRVGRYRHAVVLGGKLTKDHSIDLLVFFLY